MKSVNSNFKVGSKVIFEGEPYLIESSEFIKPGKGQAFVRVKFRRLLTGQLLDKTFKATDSSLELADVIEINLIYLYNDGYFWYFMNEKNFEQFLVEKKILMNQLKWLIEQNSYLTTLWNNKIISIIPNNFIKLKVIETEQFKKGDIFGSGEKIAVLENKIKIKVPLFISIGDFIKVDTRSSLYISRIKK
ncbi:Elongation factor P [Buchnera aphidicola (Tetraneura ulmi)]|uniref:elongation factor P n=1 Tax=Buchnera aphidicola TaxID=9 RepID=UPI003464B7CA